MEKFVMVGNTKVMDGTKAFLLLSSKENSDKKLGARLVSYCNKAEKVNYDVNELAKLRKEFSDVL